MSCISHVQTAVGNDRVIPRLAVEHIDASLLDQPVRIGLQQGHESILSGNDDLTTLLQQNGLAKLIAAAMPAPSARCGVDAGIDVLIESEDQVVKDQAVVEGRSQES